MKYTLEGNVRIKTGGERKFTKSFDAKSEKHAKELLFSFFGSKNNVKRSQIKIVKVSKVNE